MAAISGGQGRQGQIRFQALKMAAISRDHGRLRSNSRTKCLLPLAVSLPSFSGITKIDLEKCAKM